METQDIQKLLGSVQDESLSIAAGRQMRAWHRLQPALWGEVSEEASAPAGFWASRLLTLGAVAAIALAVGLAAFLPTTPGGESHYATAQQPDIYATTFYSSQAHADVVWISGLQSVEVTGNTP